MLNALKAFRVIAVCATLAFKIPPKMRIADWLCKYVSIPQITGALMPGPLDTKLNPPFEGLFDLLAQRHVHYFTLAKSARVGGTLFAISYVLHQIGTGAHPIFWLDPSRSSARALARRELQPFLLECPPVAEQAIVDREHWTAAMMFFRGGSFLKVAGAGSPNESAGFQAEIIVINEGDKVHHTTKGEAPAHELAIVRSKQFRHTRKIIENSTPTDEFGPTWRRFLKGSQHYCYIPCPHCGLKQRLTFFPEEKEVPFDEELNPLPPGQVRIEKTGKMFFDHCRVIERREVEPGKFEDVPTGWDYDRVLAETYYECAHGCRIEYHELNKMLRRYKWVQHNRKAPRDHVSPHYWAAYSPFEHWGEIAKKYLLAIGDFGAMHDFYNNDLGLPFKAVATEVDESDIQRLVKASPHYLLRTIPLEPEMMTMTTDVQQQGSANPFWWLVFAWGVDWSKPDWPTWGALVDYGPAVSWEQIEEIAGIRADPKGHWNEYAWKNPITGELKKIRVEAGLVDSGDQAQSEANVYEFCLSNSDIFSPSKGGSRAHLRGQLIRLTPVYDNKLQLIWYWSDVFCQTVYRRIIKDRKLCRYLPVDLNQDFFDQLTDEHTVMENGRLIWKARRKNNHLGDCWKLQEVLSGTVEEVLDEIRLRRKLAEEAAAEVAAADKK